MRYTELVEGVQKQVREPLSYYMLDTILRACFIVMIRALEKGEMVDVPGFGYFDIDTTSTRTITNNLAGQTKYQLLGRKKVHFHPSPSWMEELNEEV